MRIEGSAVPLARCLTANVAQASSHKKEQEKKEEELPWKDPDRGAKDGVVCVAGAP